MDNDNSQEQQIVNSSIQVDHTKNKFFDNIMSVDETRFSVLMVCLVCSLIFAGYVYVAKGDVSQNWVSIVEVFAYCVTGINVASAVSNNSNGSNKLVNFVKSAFSSSTSSTIQTQQQNQINSYENKNK